MEAAREDVRMPLEFYDNIGRARELFFDVEAVIEGLGHRIAFIEKVVDTYL